MLALIRKNIVVISVVVVALGAVYYFYSSSDEAPLLSDTSATQSPVSQEVLATLGNLRTIKLDNAVFDDPLFKSLSDFGVPIPPATAGRRNPFAPVGSGTAQSATTTKAATTTISH